MTYNTESYATLAKVLHALFPTKNFIVLNYPEEEFQSVREKLNNRELVTTTRNTEETKKFITGKKYLTNIPISEHNASKYIVEIVRRKPVLNNHHVIELTVKFAGSRQ